MNDPELVHAYGVFIIAIAVSVCIVLVPIAASISHYFTDKEDTAEYVRELAERIRRLDDRLSKDEELFESVERQTDHQFDALLNLLKNVKTLQEKVGVNDEEEKQ